MKGKEMKRYSILLCLASIIGLVATSSAAPTATAESAYPFQLSFDRTQRFAHTRRRTFRDRLRVARAAFGFEKVLPREIVLHDAGRGRR